MRRDLLRDQADSTVGGGSGLTRAAGRAAPRGSGAAPAPEPAGDGAAVSRPSARWRGPGLGLGIVAIRSALPAVVSAVPVSGDRGERRRALVPGAAEPGGQRGPRAPGKRLPSPGNAAPRPYGIHVAAARLVAGRSGRRSAPRSRSLRWLCRECTSDPERFGGGPLAAARDRRRRGRCDLPAGLASRRSGDPHVECLFGRRRTGSKEYTRRGVGGPAAGPASAVALGTPLGGSAEKEGAPPGTRTLANAASPPAARSPAPGCIARNVHRIFPAGSSGCPGQRPGRPRARGRGRPFRLRGIRLWPHRPARPETRRQPPRNRPGGSREGPAVVAPVPSRCPVGRRLDRALSGGRGRYGDDRCRRGRRAGILAPESVRTPGGLPGRHLSAARVARPRRSGCPRASGIRPRKHPPHRGFDLVCPQSSRRDCAAWHHE